MSDRNATEPRTERVIEIVEEYHEDRAINGDEEAVANLARALARAEAAQGAAPRAEGLDVERLAESLDRHAARNSIDGHDWASCDASCAALIAAEYARLTEQEER